MTLARALREHAVAQPAAEAIVAAGRRTSYGSLDAEVDRLASGLLALGVSPGERVAVWVSNREEYLTTYLGCLRAGAVLVPLNMRLGPSEVKYMLEQSGTGVLVLEEQFDGRDRNPVIPTLREALASPGAVVTLEGRTAGVIAYEDLLVPADEPALARADGTIAAESTAVTIYTSGTTGRPKGAMLTHGGLMHYSRCAAQVGLFASDDRVLIHVPLSTAAGSVIQTAPAIHLGAAIILLDVFEAEASLELIETEQVTCYVAPPTMLTLQLEARNFETVDLSSLRHVVTGAAPVPPELAKRVAQRMSVRVTNCYGATETGGLVTYVPPEASPARRSETCGRPIPGYELRVVDSDRSALPRGEVGEIAVRGESVMAGYHGSPEHTADALDGEGWWYSGDLGTVDADGYLQIVGRQKDMYIRGGYNVYPAEVEAVLECHPDVVTCAVVGYADPVLGERGRAFVVTRRDEVTADELRAHCEQSIADYKVPDEVCFIGELPLIGPGKVDRAALATAGEER